MAVEADPAANFALPTRNISPGGCGRKFCWLAWLWWSRCSLLSLPLRQKEEGFVSWRVLGGMGRSNGSGWRWESAFLGALRHRRLRVVSLPATGFCKSLQSLMRPVERVDWFRYWSFLWRRMKGAKRRRKRRDAKVRTSGGL